MNFKSMNKHVNYTSFFKDFFFRKELEQQQKYIEYRKLRAIGNLPPTLSLTSG